MRRRPHRRVRQRTAKFERVISAIKVMDPTHPLFGKTLRLISEQCSRGKALVAVALEDGRRRLIARSATDLESKKYHGREISWISARSLLPLARHIQCCLLSLNLEPLDETGPPPERIRRSVNSQPSLQSLPHPREAPPPEASSRLAQQIATILQRIRTESPGRVEHVRRGH